jgi:outer membrane protein assembly factor BamB
MLGKLFAKLPPLFKTRHMKQSMSVAIIFLCAVSNLASGQDRPAVQVVPATIGASHRIAWPQFRGLRGDGISESPLATQWSETTNIAWKTDIPGRGWSSPVVDRDLIWMTSAVETEIPADRVEAVQREKVTDKNMASQMTLSGSITLFAVALDADGKIAKQVKLFHIDEPTPVHKLNSNASPTPVLAHGRVYCHFGTNGTACVDATTGDVVWRKRYPLDHGVGPGSSPVVFDNLVILVCDGVDAQFLVALDADTGNEVWKTNRPAMSGDQGDLHKAFSTPTLIEFDGQPQLIAPGAQWFVAYHPRTGKEIWRVQHGDGFSNVPAAVVGHGMAFLCTGYMQPQLWAIRLGGQGDVTSSHVVWRIKKSVPNMPSPIVVGDQVVFVSDQGVVSRVDALNGELTGQRRIGGNYSASPLLAGGKLYFCSREGQTTVLEPDPQLSVISVNSVEGQIMASPAAWGDSLLLRTDTAVYSIRDSVKRD